MGATVAGVVEETAFRGYMQSHLERIGPTFAISGWARADRDCMTCIYKVLRKAMSAALSSAVRRKPNSCPGTARRVTL